MIHGYADSKESWMEFSSVVGTAHGVVIPDLAGYGASVMAENGDIGVEAQVERVAAIIAALKLAPVHLAGVSMGGEIAGLVAARHPDKVKTLALFNTAGGASDTNTALVAQIDRGENPFDVQSVEDLRRLIGTMRTMPVSLPGPVERSVVSQFVSHRELWRNALADLKSVPVRSLLDSLAPTITAPTLIVWGEDDALFHPSIGRRLHARIAGSQFVLVPKCGHACVFEKPDSLGAQYVAFLKGR
jgi:pimeloyl-ACP methyl ester carboxylesterase